MRNCSLLYCVSAVCLLLSSLNAGKAQLLGKFATLHRWKRQSCGSDGFQCKSGTCIKSTLMCDGAVNCDDGSDETKEACLNTVVCPTFAFQCNYGACVDADFKCDGKKDCADGSDEAGCPGSTTIAGGTKCGPNTLQCRSGQCIEETRKCDGKKDCNDGTDETREQCGFISCPNYAFQCVYGACIDGDARCNGVVECADGSDENSQVCGEPSQPIDPPVRPPVRPPTPTPAPPSPGCVLPQYPEYGTYDLGGCAPPCPPPGTDVGNSALLNFSCNAGYSLSGSTIMFCQNGKWQYQQPTCTSVSCDPLVSVSRDIRCNFNKNNVPCNQRMSVGTVANVQCMPFYNQAAELNIFQMVCQSSGKWSRELSSCIPECGTRNAEGVPFISSGIKTKLGQFPWHVGIYRLLNGSLQQSCGGSLISSHAVISAAHCFYDENERQFDKNGYRIGVGKYYRDWDTRNKYFQEGQIEDIVLPDRYKGVKFRYESDIAIIKLKVEIQINIAVRPICIDRDLRYENIQLSNGQLGAVSGWGVNENDEPSSELMAAYLPYIDFNQCYYKVPSTFQTFLTTDKFCAGHQNGTSVCPGDSGGGLMFEDSQTKKWYLQGIVSVGVPPKGAHKCYTMQYSAFTRVSRYYNFIDENMIR